jgi:hypothetical protein
MADSKSTPKQREFGCHLCGAKATLRCQGCMSAYYCGDEHQRTDRSAHRHTCGSKSVSVHVGSSVGDAPPASKGRGAITLALHELAERARRRNAATHQPRVGDDVSDLVSASDEQTRTSLLQHFYALLSAAASAMERLTWEAVYSGSARALLSVASMAREIVSHSLQASREALCAIAKQVVAVLDYVKSMLWASDADSSADDRDTRARTETTDQLDSLGGELDTCATLMASASDVAVRLMRQAVQWLLKPFEWLAERVEQAVQFAAAMLGSTADAAALVAEEVREKLAKASGAATRLKRSLPNIGELASRVLDEVAAVSAFCVNSPHMIYGMASAGAPLVNEYVTDQLATLLPRLAELWQRYLAPVWERGTDNAWTRSVRRLLASVPSEPWFVELVKGARTLLAQMDVIERLVKRAMAWLTNALNLHQRLFRPLVDFLMYKAGGGRLAQRLTAGISAAAESVQKRLAALYDENNDPTPYVDADGRVALDMDVRAMDAALFAVRVVDTLGGTPEQHGSSQATVDTLKRRYRDLAELRALAAQRLERIRREMGFRRYSSELVAANWRHARAVAPLVRGREPPPPRRQGVDGVVRDEATAAAMHLKELLTGADEELWQQTQTTALIALELARQVVVAVLPSLERLLSEVEVEAATAVLEARGGATTTAGVSSSLDDTAHVGPQQGDDGRTSSALVQRRPPARALATADPRSNIAAVLQHAQELRDMTTQAQMMHQQRTNQLAGMLSTIYAGSATPQVSGRRYSPAQQLAIDRIRFWNTWSFAVAGAITGGFVIVWLYLSYRSATKLLDGRPMFDLMLDENQLKLNDDTRARALLVLAVFEQGAAVNAAARATGYSAPLKPATFNSALQRIIINAYNAIFLGSNVAAEARKRREQAKDLLAAFSGVEITEKDKAVTIGTLDSLLSHDKIETLLDRFLCNAKFHKALQLNTEGSVLADVLAKRLARVVGAEESTVARAVDMWKKLHAEFTAPETANNDAASNKRNQWAARMELSSASAIVRDALTEWLASRTGRIFWAWASEALGINFHVGAITALASSTLGRERVKTQSDSQTGRIVAAISDWFNGAVSTTYNVVAEGLSSATALWQLSLGRVLGGGWNGIETVWNTLVPGFYVVTRLWMIVYGLIETFTIISDVVLVAEINREYNKLAGSEQLVLPIPWMAYNQPWGARVLHYVKQMATRWLANHALGKALVGAALLIPLSVVIPTSWNLGVGKFAGFSLLKRAYSVTDLMSVGSNRLLYKAHFDALVQDGWPEEAAHLSAKRFYGDFSRNMPASAGAYATPAGSNRWYTETTYRAHPPLSLANHVVGLPSVEDADGDESAAAAASAPAPTQTDAIIRLFPSEVDDEDP